MKVEGKTIVFESEEEARRALADLEFAKKLVDRSERYKSLLQEGVQLMEATVTEVNGMGYKTPGEDDWIERAREALK